MVATATVRPEVGHDVLAPRGGGGEHTVVRDGVDARRRDLRGEPGEQCHRVHDHGGLAAAPRMTEAIEDITLLGKARAQLGV
jgi:hypothetical protein